MPKKPMTVRLSISQGWFKPKKFNPALRCKLPRDLAVNPVVRALYTETWDALQAEK